jgi:nucleoside-diphosphate-sugar epimerase
MRNAPRARELVPTAAKVLVVGGNSRAATAFRKRAAADPSLALTILVRNTCPSTDREEMVEVADYFDLPERLLRGFDIVINFAGITHGRDIALLDAVNVKGPQRLAGRAAQEGVQRFIHLSSFHVYGYAERISISTPEAPVTPYGRSKLEADKALLALGREGFAVTILRLPMLYGPRTGDNLARLAALMRRIGFFPVPRTKSLRSIHHVENLAVVLQTIVKRQMPGIQFSADPDPFTLEDMARAIGEVTGVGPRLVRLPDSAFLPLRWLSKGIFHQLYRSNLVQPADCVEPDESFPMRLYDGLRELVSKERATA